MILYFGIHILQNQPISDKGLEQRVVAAGCDERATGEIDQVDATLKNLPRVLVGRLIGYPPIGMTRSSM